MQNFFNRVMGRVHAIVLPIRQQVFEQNEEKIIEKLGHRLFIGKEFEQEGLRQFEYVKSLGVAPDTRFLDVACGSLRLGRHLIPYLNKEGYFGIEQHQSLIDSGLEHEIDAEIVSEKLPRFFVSSSFELGDLKGIDIAWANSLFSHLVEKDILTCLTRVKAALTNGGVFYATFFEGKKSLLTQRFGSHSRVGFLYSKEEMMAFGKSAGLVAEYFGDVENSRGQKMMAFRKP